MTSSSSSAIKGRAVPAASKAPNPILPGDQAPALSLNIFPNILSFPNQPGILLIHPAPLRPPNGPIPRPQEPSPPIKAAFPKGLLSTFFAPLVNFLTAFPRK